MSANNQLVIENRGENWTVSDVDVDAGGGFLISNTQYKTLESAVKAANKYMQKYEVEYGLDIKI